VTAIATGCPKLRSVYLGLLDSNCDAIHTFASHCPELQSIDGVSLQLTDAGLAALASNCADFSTLNSTVWEVTDESVVHAAHLLLPRLRRIILIEAKKSVHTECYNNTLVQAVAYMRGLRTFILYASSASIGLQAVLAITCSELRGVAFSFDNSVHDPATGAALANLVRRNPLLEYLQWPGNGWLSDDVLATTAACCPLLRELCAECKIPPRVDRRRSGGVGSGLPSADGGGGTQRPSTNRRLRDGTGGALPQPQNGPPAAQPTGHGSSVDYPRAEVSKIGPPQGV
jgi:hypothetical protein